MPVTGLETAESEARTYAEWLAGHGYAVTVHRYSTALDNYGPESSRTRYAAGYTVDYAGQLIRDDGSMAEYPTAGITVFCQDDQLPLDKIVSAGRALVTFGDNGVYTAYYVAGWNDRKSDKARDASLHGGTSAVPYVLLHVLTPLIGGDGPKRFYDLRLSAAL